MKKVVINAQEVCGDIRSGLTDQELMLKYKISPDTLVQLKKELLLRRLVTPREIEAQGGAPVQARKKINAGRFLADFRERPDDLYLMEKYGLKPRQLKKVYDSLIAKHMLSEYEYEYRDRKAPELDQEIEAPPAASTVVSVVESAEFRQMSAQRAFRSGDLPEAFFRDYSGIKIGSNTGPPPGIHRQASTVVEGRKSGFSTVVDIVDFECCPNCGVPKHVDSKDSCLSCGIVFAKARSSAKQVYTPDPRDTRRRR